MNIIISIMNDIKSNHTNMCEHTQYIGTKRLNSYTEVTEKSVQKIQKIMFHPTLSTG